MNQISFHYVMLMTVLVMAAMAVVPSTATAGRSGNTRIRWSNNGNHNSQRRSGSMMTAAEGKSQNIYNYHLIAQHTSLLKEDGNLTSKLEGSGALIDPRCSSCISNCPTSCHPPVTSPPPTNPPCPTCPPTYPTHPTPITHPTTPTHYTHPTTPTHYTRPTTPTHYTHPTTPTHYTRPTTPTHHTYPTPFTYPTKTPHTKPPYTKPPPTEPPCHDCDDTCPPVHKPPTTKFPNLPSITYSTNCDFCDHDLYTLTCVATPFECAARCAVDLRCSHFTYIANHQGGTCILKKAFGSGGAWASSVPSPSPYVCGYIPSRALIGIFLNICVGLDITGSIRTGTA